ncbi:MAG: GGDEF domain-containing protein [Holophagaceae bacterium]|nr:GGDEF domain-containing protein [Holophagaceae bacterium]
MFNEIDRLRLALEKSSIEELQDCLHQIMATCLRIVEGSSVLGTFLKPIHDLLLVEHIPENLPPIVLLDKKYNKLFEDVKQFRSFMLSMANGDLSQRLLVKGYMAGVLKTFHANLKHLTWQTKMVSRGDFTQRVHFMGEFASSFNTMVEQLDNTRRGLIESEKKYRLLAITDTLTGLPNRHHFFEVAIAEHTRSRRYKKTFSIIMLDIDYFKKVNDTYGHFVGDLVLQAVAEQLQKSLRETDFPGRYGGEEFIALLPETSIAEAQLVAERIRHNIQDKDLIFDDRQIKVTASLGIYNFGSFDEADDVAGQSIDEIIDKADKALYSAKNKGRNRVETYSGGIST